MLGTGSYRVNRQAEGTEAAQNESSARWLSGSSKENENNHGDLQATEREKEKEQQELEEAYSNHSSSFRSAKSSSNRGAQPPLLRLSSYKKRPTGASSSIATTNTSSKNTAFYSAHSHLTPTTSTNSFRTADSHQPHSYDIMVVPRNAPAGATSNAAEMSEDEELVHAMARQYVLDAEAAGSASPSHRSRRDTDASRMVTDRSLGGDIVTTSSEDYPVPIPRLPGSVPVPVPRHAVGRDNDSGQSIDRTRGDIYVANTAHSENAPASAPALSEKYSDGSVMPPRAGEAHHIALHDEEEEDDANEARLFVPARLRYPPPRYAVKSDAAVPPGAVLFLCGFILLPLWWIGAVFPRSSRSEVARSWRKYNALMTLLSLPLLGLFLALGGWQAVHGD
ncbi:hypothetical protein IWW48_000578 [Coemansia sp. RSA 1200]|nr:hypothetical protein IWW48_000578 [Coemansia sp. RSA 1200]